MTLEELIINLFILLEYSLLTCVDYVSLCTNQQYCTQAGATISYSVALLCKKTCNQCSGQTCITLKFSLYQNLIIYNSLIIN